MKNVFLFFAFTLSTLFSCKEALFKEQYVSNFESFIEDIRKNQSNFSKEDWKAKEEQFKFFTEVEYNKFKDDLTSEQKAKINSLKGNFYTLYAKGKAGELGDQLKDLLQQAEGALEEIEK